MIIKDYQLAWGLKTKFVIEKLPRKKGKYFSSDKKCVMIATITFVCLYIISFVNTKSFHLSNMTNSSTKSQQINNLVCSREKTKQKAKQ